MKTTGPERSPLEARFLEPTNFLGEAARIAPASLFLGLRLRRPGDVDREALTALAKSRWILEDSLMALRAVLAAPELVVETPWYWDGKRLEG